MIRFFWKLFFFNERCRLLQLSMLMLFVELTLIRWTAANIAFLSFYANFVLLASFLGMGVGFLRSTSARNSFHFSPMLLALVIFIVYQFSYTYKPRLNPLTDDLSYFATLFKDNLFPVHLSLPIVFIAVSIVMLTLAEGVARSFQKFAPLQAYRLEISGSLLGVLLFSLLSFLHATPLWWGVVMSVLFIALLSSEWRAHKLLAWLQVLSLVCMMIPLVKQSTAPDYLWSAYYKIQVQSYSQGRSVINVNGLPQQFIESVAQRKKYKPFYFYPYQHLAAPHDLDKVLVVGAGTGGDVAIALALGAKHVDAVEIDPMLYQLGKQLNPDRPYFDLRVSMYTGDGRAFLQQQHYLYDMIIFALPDSLMILPGQASLRLENYLFTLEGIKQVREHLKQNGVFTMYNYYRHKWIVDRYANTIMTVFGQAPCLNSGGERNLWLSVLTVSASPTAMQCNSPWQAVTEMSTTPSTDNHPFLYLKDKTISGDYIYFFLFVVLITLGAIKWVGGAGRAMTNHGDLFFMGAAFLLLETKSVTHFALLFGSTWLVNALVFFGVLFSIYIAIEVANRYTLLRPLFLYSLLLASLLLSWAVSDDFLLTLSLPLRFLSSIVLAFTPILVANLIFADRFRHASHSTDAFAANVLGAVLGGLLEYVSFITGYRSLLVLVAVLYTIAVIVLQWRSRVNTDLTIFSTK